MSIKKNILDKIEADNIKPVSRFYFLSKKYYQFFLLILLLLSGIFFTLFFIGDFFENIANFRLRYFYIPVFWFILIIVFVFFVYFKSKNTGKLYKYPFGVVFITTISIFILISLFLYNSSLGILLNNSLGEKLGFSKFSLRQEVWTDVQGGKLAGVIESIDSNIIILKDLKGNKHSIKITKNDKFNDIKIGNKIRVMGLIGSDGIFVASKIMPWFGNGNGLRSGQKQRFNN